MICTKDKLKRLTLDKDDLFLSGLLIIAVLGLAYAIICLRTSNELCRQQAFDTTLYGTGVDVYLNHTHFADNGTENILIKRGTIVDNQLYNIWYSCKIGMSNCSCFCNDDYYKNMTMYYKRNNNYIPTIFNRKKIDPLKFDVPDKIKNIVEILSRMIFAVMGIVIVLSCICLCTESRNKKSNSEQLLAAESINDIVMTETTINQ